MEKTRMPGYIAAIIANAVLLWVFNSLPQWHVPFITERFADCLWAINLSIVATILANAVFMSYDPVWFRRLAQIGLDVLGLISAYTLLTVFPFNFSSWIPNSAIRIALIVGVVGVAISIVVRVVQLVLGICRVDLAENHT